MHSNTHKSLFYASMARHINICFTKRFCNSKCPLYRRGFYDMAGNKCAFRFVRIVFSCPFLKLLYKTFNCDVNGCYGCNHSIDDGKNCDFHIRKVLSEYHEYKGR